MATMNVSLPQEMKDWVEHLARSGDYANSSDVIRDLIRKDKERRQALAELQALVDEGMESGPPEDFEFDAFRERMRSAVNG